MSNLRIFTLLKSQKLLHPITCSPSWLTLGLLKATGLSRSQWFLRGDSSVIEPAALSVFMTINLFPSICI